METQLKVKNIKEVISFLAEHFPYCFSTKGEIRPLKIGIFQDLVERIQGKYGLSKTKLRSALRIYTSSWRYLYGIKTNAIRVDLDGNDCGMLNGMHVEYARKQLEEAKARNCIKREQLKDKKYKFNAKDTEYCSYKNISYEILEKDKFYKSNSQSQILSNKFTISSLTIQPGQNIKVKIGTNVMNVTVLEIFKDSIRVQHASGIAIIIRAKHIYS